MQPQMEPQINEVNEEKVFTFHAVPPSNSITFVGDEETVKLIRMMHPELTNAALNIAVKKFAESSDFFDYFIREEFKEVVEKEIKREETKQKEESKPASTTSTPSGAIDFTTW
jgi:hypothetical protein